MMTIATANGTQSGMMQTVQSTQTNIDDNNPSSVTTSSGHEHNISYVDPIDEALHTSYQWSMPGVSIDHVCVYYTLHIVYYLYWTCLMLSDGGLFPWGACGRKNTLSTDYKMYTCHYLHTTGT